jgi:16S rRNA (adenine1518-N6/adenine1519-N6)-dimethyltransferase
MSFLNKAKFLLRKYRIFPKKSLGQNFMVDSSIIQNMVNYASLDANDIVLDIGAGLGFLTYFMANECGKVLAVEPDANLINLLRDELAVSSNVKIIHSDVFKAKIPEFNKVVSIPPYYISSPLLLWLFRQNFDCAVLIFQREFVDRLAASVGSSDYGWLAVVAYYYVESELLDAVPKWMFYPPPEVDSLIVRLKPKKSSPFRLKNEALFKQLAQSLFTHRNQKIKNALASFTKGAHYAGREKVFESFPFLDKRVRELAPEDIGALTNALVK